MSKSDLKLTKIEVVVRQIETALFLFFYEKDEVSTHTLTMAGYNILRDLCKDVTNVVPFYKPLKSEKLNEVKDGTFLSTIKEKYRKEILKRLNEPENFFKHADKDGDQILNFNPESTILFLHDSVRMLKSNFSIETFLMFAFRSWFMTHYPNMFLISTEDKKRLEGLKSDSLDGFRKDSLPILRELWRKHQKTIS